MSTQAKYSWAIGLVIVGIVFALPFRQTGSPQVAESQNENSTAESSNVSSAQVLMKSGQPSTLSSENQNTKSSQSTKSSQNNLLPNVPEVGEQKPKSVPTVEPPKLSHGSGSNFSEGSVVSNDQPATLQAVEFSNQVARKTMPESVGPYQMKQVPSSRFLAASQSNADGGQVFSTASRTRNVIHYKLRDGDTLRSIAQRYLGSPDRYTEIMSDNAHIFTNGENFLPIGQFITIIVQ